MLERQGKVHGCGFGLELPFGRIDGKFADTGNVFVFEGAVFLGVLVDVFGDAHVLFAILADFVDFARFPPFDGFQSRGALAYAEGGACHVVEAHASSDGFLYFHHNVHAFDAGQVARIILIEKGNVEVVRIVADDKVGSFENRPKFRKIFLQKTRVFSRFVVVDNEEGNVECRRIVFSDVAEGVLGFDIENDFSHRRKVTG